MLISPPLSRTKKSRGLNSGSVSVCVCIIRCDLLISYISRIGFVMVLLLWLAFVD